MISKQPKLFVSSDYLFNRPEKMDDFKAMGADIVPVDMNGAYVPSEKEGAKHFENAQCTMKRWFM